MEWWNTVIWSWRNMELTNGKLVILIPLCLLLLYDLLLLTKGLWCICIQGDSEISLIYRVRMKAMYCYYTSEKITLEEYKTIQSAFCVKELLIPFHKWMLNPFKWTFKSRFVKDGYKALMKLDSYLESL